MPADSEAASCAVAGTAYGSYPGVSCGTFVGKTQETGGNVGDIIQAASEVGITLTAGQVIDKTDSAPVIAQVAVSEAASPSGSQGVITSSVPFQILGLKGGNGPFDYAFYVFATPVTSAAFNTYDAGLRNSGGNAPGLSFGVVATPLPAAAWLFLSALGGLGLIARRRQKV
jgi:hypothetical protein